MKAIYLCKTIILGVAVGKETEALQGTVFLELFADKPWRNPGLGREKVCHAFDSFRKRY